MRPCEQGAERRRGLQHRLLRLSDQGAGADCDHLRPPSSSRSSLTCWVKAPRSPSSPSSSSTWPPFVTALAMVDLRDWREQRTGTLAAELLASALPPLPVGTLVATLAFVAGDRGARTPGGARPLSADDLGHRSAPGKTSPASSASPSAPWRSTRRWRWRSRTPAAAPSFRSAAAALNRTGSPASATSSDLETAITLAVYGFLRSRRSRQCWRRPATARASC